MFQLFQCRIHDFEHSYFAEKYKQEGFRWCKSHKRWELNSGEERSRRAYQWASNLHRITTVVSEGEEIHFEVVNGDNQPVTDPESGP